MKKTLALLIGLAIMLSLIPPVALAEEPYSYSMVMYNFGPLDEDPIMVKKWEEKYGVDFNLIYVEQSSAAEQINLLVAGGEIPDVMQSINAQSYFEQGIIGGWTEEFFRAHAPRLAAYTDATDANAWGYAKYDGELMYSIPGFRLYNTVTSPIIIRTDWLKNVGIEKLPVTIEEYEDMFYKFAKNDPDGNGVDDTYGLSKEMLPAIYGAFGLQRGYWQENGDGTVSYGDVQPAAKDALALLNKWYKDGVMDPEFITGENQGGYWAITHAFLNGRIGTSGMGSFYHWVDATEFEGGKMQGRMRQAIVEAGVDMEYEPGYAPVGPEGKSGTKLSHVTCLRTHFSAPLVADEAKFGRLLEIIDDMMMDLDTATQVSRGIEGETYEIVDFNGGKAVKMLVANNTDAVNPMGAAAWFMFTEEYSFDFQYMAYAEDFAWFDKYMADKNVGYTNAIFGALPSQTMYKAECDKILNEGYIAIITGEKPLDYFDEMVAQWNKAGGEILTQEATEVYKREKGI